MLTKKDFLKYASTLAFPIMLQNLIGTLVNIADTVMLGYVSQTAMSASSLANQYTFILFCLYYGMATGTSVLCAQYWGKGDKKTVEKILGLAERISLIISLIFFVISFTMPTAIMKIFTNSPETIAAGSEYLKVISFSFVFMGFSQIFMSALRGIGKIMLPWFCQRYHDHCQPGAWERPHRYSKRIRETNAGNNIYCQPDRMCCYSGDPPYDTGFLPG